LTGQEETQSGYEKNPRRQAGKDQNPAEPGPAIPYQESAHKAHASVFLEALQGEGEKKSTWSIT